MSGEAVYPDQQSMRVLVVLRDWISAGNGALHVEAHELDGFVREVMAAMGSDQ